MKKVSILTVDSLHHNGWLDISDPRPIFYRWAPQTPQVGPQATAMTDPIHLHQYFPVFLNQKLKPGLQNGFLHTSQGFHIFLRKSQPSINRSLHPHDSLPRKSTVRFPPHRHLKTSVNSVDSSKTKPFSPILPYLKSPAQTLFKNSHTLLARFHFFCISFIDFSFQGFKKP